ncbi:uncharacterized protein JCM6883_007258 [Sporobolomyces salmoneus]|uniref:uncharacterized protein n=1 Tax=Sporobolomyces salmoneus TaxID=183962 RepID=UPI00317AFF4E
MASTFRPQHDQPVTLAELSTLEPELLVNEISRLENSLKHLKRSNEELKEFIEVEDDEETKAEFVNTVFENQETIAKQEERIQMIRLALEEQIGVQASNSHYSTREDTIQSTSTSAPTQQSTRNEAAEEDEEEEVTGMAGAVRRSQVESERRTGNESVESQTTQGRNGEQDESSGMYL